MLQLTRMRLLCRHIYDDATWGCCDETEIGGCVEALRRHSTMGMDEKWPQQPRRRIENAILIWSARSKPNGGWIQIGVDVIDVFMPRGAPVEAAGRVFAFGQIEDRVPVAMMARNINETVGDGGRSGVDGRTREGGRSYLVVIDDPRGRTNIEVMQRHSTRSDMTTATNNSSEHVNRRWSLYHHLLVRIGV